MKLEKLVIHEDALKELAKVKLTDHQKAWDLSVALDTANTHLKKFKEKQDAVVKEMGTEVKDQPENYQIPPEKFKAFNDEIEKLSSVDVKVVFPKVKIELLKGTDVSAESMSAWRDLGILTKK
jgi:predicted membrane chloride channel (bestrophin family)